MNNHTDWRCQPIEKRNIRPAYTRLANNEAVAVLIEQTRCLEREKRQNFRSGNVKKKKRNVICVTGVTRLHHNSAYIAWDYG